MVLTLPEYESLRHRLYHFVCNREHVRQLKFHFRDDINSQRSFESISSLPKLLKILEKRDVITYDQQENFEYILNIVLPNSSIGNNNNNNGFEGIGNRSNVPRMGQVLPQVYVDPVDRIHELIRSDMGHKWKELARALTIGEGKIDSLEDRYRGNIAEMVNEVLQWHKDNCGAHFELWRSRLQEALERARRRDLSLEINRILTFSTQLRSS